MYNKVTLVGRLVRDPELRYTTTGKAVANFTIAVDRGFSKEQGESNADFIKIVTWDKQAETVGNLLKKGRLVLVDGSIRTGSYDGKDGQKVYTTEVQASRVVFLDRGDKQGENAGGSISAPANDVADVFGLDDDDVPF